MQHIVRQAAPMTPQILRLLRQNLNLPNPSDATFRALFLITVFTMARKSNLVPDRADLFNPEKQLPKEKILVGDGCLLVFLKWTKNIQIPGPLCVLSLLIVTCVNSLHYKIIRQPFHSFPVLAQFRLCMHSSMVSWNNWSKHVASNPDDYSTHSFSGVGPHAHSEPEYPIRWFSCKVTGHQIVTKDTYKWIWWRSEMFLWGGGGGWGWRVGWGVGWRWGWGVGLCACIIDGMGSILRTRGSPKLSNVYNKPWQPRTLSGEGLETSSCRLGHSRADDTQGPG